MSKLAKTPWPQFQGSLNQVHRDYVGCAAEIANKAVAIIVCNPGFKETETAGKGYQVDSELHNVGGHFGMGPRMAAGDCGLLSI